jgi:diadenosine tetraphosphatase ApaH/serine/threonine PP2A family protein phosphatase
MKIALISDIHSNLHALNRALATIDKYNVDAVYCLGDIVGYGADPSPCVDLVQRHCAGAVLGNHDLAVAQDNGTEYLPRSGQAAIKHNRARLSESQLEYLRSLPYVLEADGCTFVHATPKDPELWIRFDTLGDVRDQFEYFNTPFCFVGHTHVPAVVADKLGVFRVRQGCRYIVNVGSVGQPRDSDARLAFVIFDTNEIKHELVRVGYDVEGAAARIIADGLPKDLASRLRRGK